MADGSADKTERVLSIYTKLMNGVVVNKAEEADNFHVNERSIQRDIDDIRNYLDQEAVEQGIFNEVIYDRDKKGYRLDQIYKLKLSNPEILAICKILLDSRAFTKKEMNEILHKLVECCVPQQNQKLVDELIKNEEFHYIEPRHNKIFIDKLWIIGQAIHGNNFLEINYQRTKDKAIVKRKVKPLAIMFSEYYFYMAAFIDDEDVRQDFDVLNDSYPTIYRVDRIQSIHTMKERFHIPYTSRFEEGEFRKRIQFMYGGKLKKIKFKYFGYSVEAILDRLPTAQIIDECEGGYIISAEVFGDGVDMWIRSQGTLIQLLEESNGKRH